MGSFKSSVRLFVCLSFVSVSAQLSFAQRPIGSCTTIDEPGSYALVADVQAPTPDPHCIEITSSDVHFDGAGHTIAGPRTPPDTDTYGVLVYNPKTPLTNVVVTNLWLAHWRYGIEYFHAASSAIQDSNIRCDYGVSLRSSTDITVKSSVIDSEHSGVLLTHADSNTVASNRVKSLTAGLFFTDSSNNTVRDNYVEVDNPVVHVNASSWNNLIYNNDFRTPAQPPVLLAPLEEGSGAHPAQTWSIPKTPAAPNHNIVGGPFLGGNYWSSPQGTGFSQTCGDADTDGICDNAMNVLTTTPCTPGRDCPDNTDYLPLMTRDYDQDGVPDSLDNCPIVSNRAQTDIDDDGIGDVCDNCPGVRNPDQSDLDGDLQGDVCDEDIDGDGCSNAVDPSPYVYSDADGDRICDELDPCPADPGNDEDGDGICRGSGYRFPMAGDNDNCPTYYNAHQADVDGDGQGDACDCDDGLRGAQETGVDCGGLCSANDCCTNGYWDEFAGELGLDCGGSCSAPCPPCAKIFQSGPTAGKMDVAFLPASDYQYLGDFFADVRRAMTDVLYTAPISETHDKFNFYYMNQTADANAGCGGKTPSQFEESPSCDPMDVVAILHATPLEGKDYADCTSGKQFTANTDTFIHEFGHAAFNLTDEYDGDTAYEQASYPTNVYESRDNCRAHTQNAPDACGLSPFSTRCVGGFLGIGDHCEWWKADWDRPEVMNSTSTRRPWTFGLDCTARIRHVLGKYVDPPAEPVKVVKLRMRVSNGVVSELERRIEYGDPPDQLSVFRNWEVVVLSGSGSVLQHFSIRDPRIQAPDPNSPYGWFGDNKDFTLTFKMEENVRRVNITNEAKDEAIEVDLGPTVHDFCAGHPDDAECRALDLDADGILDKDDKCPLDAGNDADGDGVCGSDGDCDDADVRVYPGAPEWCDGKDNDCDGQTDENACYRYSGILPPIKNDGSSVFNGAVVPVKFWLQDKYGSGSYVSTAIARLYVAKVSNGVPGTELAAVSGSGATTGNLLRYDVVANQYVFDLGTKTLARGTWRLRIELDDGSSKYAYVSLR